MAFRLLRLLTNEFSPVITPIISGVIGALVAILYSVIGKFLVGYPVIQAIFTEIWNNLDPSAQIGFEPKSIGIGVATLCYMIIQEWLNKFFLNSIKEDQKNLNEVLPASEHIKVDGIPLEETRKAKNKIFNY